jgi:DNA modification methylase
MDRQHVTGTAQILRADSRQLPIADDTVDLVVTSPPYFGLRSYQDGGEHYDGQIGDEPTPAEFLDALLEVTRECVRVLKPSGSLWVNLGDKYSNGGRTSYDVTDINGNRGGVRTPDGFRAKTLLGIPWRYAIRCIDELGLILRAEVVWSKPNGLPESVTDRVRRSHEQWFHFTREPRYYSAVDEIREGHVGPLKSPGSGKPSKAIGPLDRNGHSQWDRSREERDATVRHALGKLPGSVWEIATEPLIVPDHLGVDHFAAFPTEWPRRIIQGWSPAGVCVECGEGRRPVSVGERTDGAAGAVSGAAFGPSGRHSTATGKRHEFATVRAITGYACACPEPTAPTRPGVVLDPFGGTGTTALVAKALGRHGISVDMSADYCRLAEWRTTDPAQMAKAARRPFKPSAPPIEGQSDLLAMLTDNEEAS